MTGGGFACALQRLFGFPKVAKRTSRGRSYAFRTGGLKAIFHHLVLTIVSINLVDGLCDVLNPRFQK